jgi:catechol 2,3-dioxygenase-like lactoylglutathione lyase family enzyme
MLSKEDKTMARVKHIAIRTHDIEKTAAFYKEAFGLEQVGAAQNGIYLTDGYLNVAILTLRPAVEGETMKLGLDHIGFSVDDVDATVAKIRALGGKALDSRNEVRQSSPSQPQSYFEVKCVAPDDQVIDVSNAGWVGASK